MDIEARNLQQIRRTNQRGGRCLSIIDLLEAGTLSPRVAALCWGLIDRGTSLITGAVPGGAGKTTLMAALLAFLPPGEQIVTARDLSVVERTASGEFEVPVCLLAHEIGRGSWFAYIWGRTARRFFACNGPGKRPVTCLHADTPDQTAGILRECGVAEADIESTGLHLYIRAFGNFRPRRRVTAVHCRLGNELMPVCEWDEAQDEFRFPMGPGQLAAGLEEEMGLPSGAFAEEWEARRHCLEHMQNDAVRDLEAVRLRVIEFCGEHP